MPSATGKPAKLSPTRQATFTAVSVALPFILLAFLEFALRLGNYGGDLSLFTPFTFNGQSYLVANPRVGARYFPRDHNPPAPAQEPFLAAKPARSHRVIVMGESAAAGFPFAANGSFADYIESALERAFPRDTVEVINLGIAATNSYTIADLADDVVAQRPDAVLIYAGHNEYYGALGIGSTERLGAIPSLVRLYLGLQRFKTVLLLRNTIARATDAVRGGQKPTSGPAATRMETVAQDQRIEFRGRTYERGRAQLESNLRIALGKFRAARVPVFIGSLSSNLRDQPPFSSLSGLNRNGQEAVAYTAARKVLAQGNLATADSLFRVARDRDVVRFRAPSDFNETIARVAKDLGAHFVPVEQDVRAASEYRIPGADLFFEHVHFRRTGYALLGRSYLSAMRTAGLVSDSVLDALNAVDSALALTPLDERIAEHWIRTVTTRWPFVPAAQAEDYRGTYRPVDLVDSLALLVARGAFRWDRAKFVLGQFYETNGKPALALAEYRGLIRREPLNQAWFESAGRVLMALGKPDSARSFLERAHALGPTPFTTYSLGTIALEKRDLPRAIQLLEQSVRLQPNNPAALYRLSFAYALTRDIGRARATALRAAQLKPDFPGLAGWLSALGVKL